MTFFSDCDHAAWVERLIGIILASTLVLGCFWVRASYQHVTKRVSFHPAKNAAAELSALSNSRSHATVILAMQIGCHWCENSAGYYHVLMAKYSQRGVHFTVVMPQAVDQQTSFLTSLSLPVSDVRQVSFTKLSIVGTPTVFVLNDNAHVLGAWEGLLNIDGETKIESCLDRALAPTRSDQDCE